MNFRWFWMYWPILWQAPLSLTVMSDSETVEVAHQKESPGSAETTHEVCSGPSVVCEPKNKKKIWKNEEENLHKQWGYDTVSVPGIRSIHMRVGAWRVWSAMQFGTWPQSRQTERNKWLKLHRKKMPTRCLMSFGLKTPAHTTLYSAEPKNPMNILTRIQTLPIVTPFAIQGCQECKTREEISDKDLYWWNTEEVNP